MLINSVDQMGIQDGALLYRIVDGKIVEYMVTGIVAYYQVTPMTPGVQGTLEVDPYRIDDVKNQEFVTDIRNLAR